MPKNIEMSVLNSEGSYDVLYPKTTPEQAGSLSISGGTMQGDLILNRDPVNNLGAASKQYVDNYVGGLVNTGEYLSDKWRLVFNQTLDGKTPREGVFVTFTIQGYFTELFMIADNLEMNGMGTDEIYLSLESGTASSGPDGLQIMYKYDQGVRESSHVYLFRKFVDLTERGYIGERNATWGQVNGNNINTGIWVNIKGDFTLYVR